MIRIATLPVPPSTNNLYRNAGRRGRVKTPEYNSWIQAAGLMLNTQKNTALERIEKGPWQCCMSAFVDNKRDLDNIIKPILDLLVKMDLAPDDRWCNRVEITRSDNPMICQKGEVTIMWSEL